ncbi:MAG: alcohol dehydrogenase catalytic domain-containing protein, partial [Myxococcaceae bacterium]
MRAVVISGPGEFRLSQVPVPLPAEGEVLVRVHAAGLNRADLLQSLGLYPPPTTSDTDIPGLEFAGEVEAQGPHSRGGIGARVMGL